MRRVVGYLSWTAAALLLAAGPLTAQEGADTLDVVPLQPVLVNVLRTPFSVTAAPFAVAANGQAEVQRARPGIAMTEALAGIPGVQVDDRYNYALGDRISIRGFGARTPFGVRGVSVFVDGIPATLPDGTTNLNHLDQAFLRRVEVIRGPASALYGNAAGGVILFESELPPRVPLSQAFGVTAGSDGLLRLNSTTGGQSGGARYLLNVSRLTYEGYRDFQDAENVQVNGSMGFTAAGGDLRLTGSFVDYDANNPGSLNAAMLAADRSQAAPANLTHHTGEDGRQGQLGASWRRPIGAGRLDLAGYGLTREIVNPIPFVTIDIERVGGGASATYHSLADPTGARFHWAAGVEGDLQSDHRLNFPHTPQGVRSQTAELDQDERVLGGAAFAQAGGTLTEGLNVLAGLRYDVTRFEADVRVPSPADSGDRTMSALSPSIGVNYEIDPALAVYANVATSFETPTTTELANQPSGAGGLNPELDPQRTISYEAGAKGLFPGRIGYSLSAYYAHIDDALIPFTAPNERTYFRNAGSAVHQGFEAGLTVAPLPDLTATAAYTYVDARFDEYVRDGESFNDNQVPGVSPHRLDASATYSLPIGLYLTAEGRYADGMFVDDANDAETEAYTLVNLRTGLERLRLGGLLIEPFVGVTNLFDEEYVTSPALNHAARRYFEPGPGRAFYAGGQVRVDLE